MTYRNRCRGRRRPRNPTIDHYVAAAAVALLRSLGRVFYPVRLQWFATEVAAAHKRAGFTPPRYDA